MTLPVGEIGQNRRDRTGEGGGTAGIPKQGDGGPLPRSKPLVCVRPKMWTRLSCVRSTGVLTVLPMTLAAVITTTATRSRFFDRFVPSEILSQFVPKEWDG